MTLTFVVHKNHFWRAIHGPPLPAFQILGVKQQDQGKYRKIWLTLDHALDCSNISESRTIVIRIDNLPGLQGQKQVEDAAYGDPRCSIMSTKVFSPNDLQAMQQACTHGTAKLTQEHTVDKSSKVDVYTIETCNDSGIEVKDLRTLKEWCARLAPTNLAAASPSGEAGFFQPLTASIQHTAQMAHTRQQPALPQLSSTKPSSKRARTVSGLREEQQVKNMPSFLHCLLLVAL